MLKLAVPKNIKDLGREKILVLEQKFLTGGAWQHYKRVAAWQGLFFRVRRSVKR